MASPGSPQDLASGIWTSLCGSLFPGRLALHFESGRRQWPQPFLPPRSASVRFTRCAAVVPRGGDAPVSVPSQPPASDSSGQPGVAGSPGAPGAASPGDWFAPLCGPAGVAGPAAPLEQADRPDPGVPLDPADWPDPAARPGRDSLSDSLSGPGGPGGPGAAAAPPAHAAGPAYSGCSKFASSGAGVPSSAGEALGMVLTGLSWLARADAASMPGPVQADCLRGLERALSVHTAARARVLTAFTAQGSYEDDGQGSPRTWLTWQTRITRPAAGAALASMRSVGEHPAIAAALSDGQISVSWARQIAGWTDLLPEDCRADADA